MKRIASGLTVAAVLVVSCATASVYKDPSEWMAASQQPGSALVLGPAAGVWSASKTTPFSGTAVDVRTKFIKHYGTTCVYDVEFTNNSGAAIEANMVLARPETLSVGGDHVKYLKVAPGETAVYEMEVRECGLHFGDNLDPAICAECYPQLAGFK